MTKVQVSLKLPPGLMAQIDKYAKAIAVTPDRKSRTAAMELLLERGLEVIKAALDAKKAPSKGQKAAG